MLVGSGRNHRGYLSRIRIRASVVSCARQLTVTLSLTCPSGKSPARPRGPETVIGPSLRCSSGPALIFGFAVAVRIALFVWCRGALCV